MIQRIRTAEALRREDISLHTVSRSTHCENAVGSCNECHQGRCLELNAWSPMSLILISKRFVKVSQLSCSTVNGLVISPVYGE